MDSFDGPDRDHDESGAAVVRRAQERLALSPYAVLGRVATSYHRGTLSLRGCLPSHYLRQIAQELVGRVEGVNDVINQIEVRAAANVGGLGSRGLGPARNPAAGPGDRGRGDSPRGG